MDFGGSGSLVAEVYQAKADALRHLGSGVSRSGSRYCTARAVLGLQASNLPSYEATLNSILKSLDTDLNSKA